MKRIYISGPLFSVAAQSGVNFEAKLVELYLDNDSVWNRFLSTAFAGRKIVPQNLQQ